MNSRTARFVILSGLALCSQAFAAGSRGLPPLFEEVCFEDGRERFADGAMSLTREGRSGDDPDTLDAPVALCFAEGYTPSAEEWAAVQRALNGAYSGRYNAAQRWNGNPGDPINLTWSFVPDGITVGSSTSPGGTGPSELFTRMDALFGAANRQTWINQFTLSFARWQALTGVNYTRVTVGGNEWDDGAAWGSAGAAGLRGDVRISMKNIDGASGILAYNSFPTSTGTNAGDMVIDRSENWATGSPSFRLLRNVIMHEHGHGLGYAHTCPVNNTKLMEPFASTSFDGPQQDDIRGGIAFYGDIAEPNETWPSAYDLGSAVGGGSITLGPTPAPAVSAGSVLGLHDGGVGSGNDDVDYYKVTLDQPHLVTVTAAPVGSTYKDYDQNSDGSCQDGVNNNNALAQADLIVTIFNSTGTAQLRTDNSSGVGLSEVLADTLLDTGVSYIRITGVAGYDETQLYNLFVTVSATSIAPTATDATFTDKVRVTWPAIPDATGYIVSRGTVNTRTSSSTIATLAANITSFDDTTAAPGVQYYYWIRCQQNGSTLYRYTTAVGAGEPGMRGVNQPPNADAGPDQTVTDSDNSGSESVTLSGTGSNDPDGTITTYTWREGVSVIATGASPSVSLGVGVHTIELTVTDNGGATDTDTVIITVEAGTPACDPDLNQDGNADQADVDYLINVIAGGDNTTGIDPDFNHDGNVDQTDVDALINVVAGAPCP